MKKADLFILFCIMMIGSTGIAQSLSDKVNLTPEILRNYYKSGSKLGPGGVHPSMWTKEAASNPATTATPVVPVNPGYRPYPGYITPHRRVFYAGSRSVKRPSYYKECKKMLGYWDPYYCAQYFGPNGAKNSNSNTVININNNNNNVNNNDNSNN